ncbi:MAG: hypothetical protein QXF97_08545 [Candidatus Caldarchaeum sp.]
MRCPYCGDDLPDTSQGDFEVDWWEKTGTVKIKCKCGKEFQQEFIYVGTYDPLREDYIDV